MKIRAQIFFVPLFLLSLLPASPLLAAEDAAPSQLSIFQSVLPKGLIFNKHNDVVLADKDQWTVKGEPPAQGWGDTTYTRSIEGIRLSYYNRKPRVLMSVQLYNPGEPEALAANLDDHGQVTFATMCDPLSGCVSADDLICQQSLKSSGLRSWKDLGAAVDKCEKINGAAANMRKFDFTLGRTNIKKLDEFRQQAGVGRNNPAYSQLYHFTSEHRPWQQFGNVLVQGSDEAKEQKRLQSRAYSGLRLLGKLCSMVHFGESGASGAPAPKPTPAADHAK